jgi:repressor of nif and glnA expression
MSGRVASHDFVDPMILKILKESRVSLSTLAINYKVNEAAGRTINLNVIRNHLIFLVKNKKIFENLDKKNDVTYYKLIL